MNEQNEEPETSQKEQGQEQEPKQEQKNKQSKEQTKPNEQNIFDTIMENGMIKKLFTGLPALILGAAGGFGISHYFSNKREEKTKKENEELKQSLSEMLKEFKKLKKKQRKLKEKQDGEGQKQEEGSFSLSGTVNSADKSYRQGKAGSVRNAYLD